MGGSRRKYKQSRPKVRVGLPKKNSCVIKPAFVLPPKLLSSLVDPINTNWDNKASVIANYKTFGVVSNPNLLSVRSRSPHMIESHSLQVPPPTSDSSGEAATVDELDDSGSDLEEDDLKTALGKKRKDGKSVPLQPLTAIQRLHVRRLVEKYGDDYESMFRDIKLNAMQHSVGTLKKLCLRYHIWKDKNLLILGKK